LLGSKLSISVKSCFCGFSKGWPGTGNAELEGRRKVPVSAAWVGGGWSDVVWSSSMSSPEKEKLKDMFGVGVCCCGVTVAG
jgi:hypothetical protein